jgi:hypothetical protein
MMRHVQRLLITLCVLGCFGAGIALPANASVLWDGLSDPTSVQMGGVSIPQGTLVGLEFSADRHGRLAGFSGYIGMPDRPVIAGRPPVVPQLGFSLWDGIELRYEGVPQVSGAMLLGQAVSTESGMRVWNLECDLSNLGWEVTGRRDYVLAISVNLPVEWLVHSGVRARSLLNAGEGWMALSSGRGWNARLALVPMPEPRLGWWVFALLPVSLAAARLRLRRRSGD